MRPGPKENLEEGLLSLVRDAITARRTLEFDYLSRAMGRRSRQCVRPYGVLYGNRTFLVGRADWANDTRLWRLANVSEARITDEAFDRDPAFDLRSYAKRSFGAFQEEPVEVALRCRCGSGREGVSVPSRPDRRRERRRFADGALQGRRNRGNMLVPRDLGRERHGRTAGRTSPAAGRNVRLARGAPSRRVSRSRNEILTTNLGCAVGPAAHTSRLARTALIELPAADADTEARGSRAKTSS